MFCSALLYVHSSIAIILMRKRELNALLNLSSCCLVMVERLFLAVPRGYVQFVIVVFPDHTHLLFLCTKHLKDIVKHYLQNRVGMEQPIRESVMDKIFGTDGITDANCTIDFESKPNELKCH